MPYTRPLGFTEKHNLTLAKTGVENTFCLNNSTNFQPSWMLLNYYYFWWPFTKKMVNGK
jgi:hypothetical protein